MTTADAPGKTVGETISQPAFLVLDSESVPDGKLLAMVKYPGENLSVPEAVARAQAEARERSREGSDFLPVSFQYPVAVCVARVGADFMLQALTCLDSPQFRPREIVETFWRGVARYSRARLVTFNGRGFDLPLMELAAFRYGGGASDYDRKGRRRYDSDLDLLDWLTNYGACRLGGGLNLLSKLLGKPGKMEVAGDQVYAMHRAGQLKEINDYCAFDTLDTYFVFLRTRVLTGELTIDQERSLIARAKEWIAEKAKEMTALEQYLSNWGDWEPWP